MLKTPFIYGPSQFNARQGLSLKEELLTLLERDKEFRYAVAGLIGLEEILKRLDRHEEILVKHSEELLRLREDMTIGFKRHDEEIAKLREDMIKGFQRHNEELAKLREDMNTGFRRYDEEMARLRGDMVKGFELVERHISALGTRWGLMTEEAFKEGLRGLLTKEFGLEVERWEAFDGEGLVHGYPSLIEVNVAVHDREVILIEISSHVRSSDATIFKKKAYAYEKYTGRKPKKLVIITPYADEKAVEACIKHGIELYTKV
ncbi:MAG: PD-(D/E)XK nuclease family protein [Candidatus Bathyarchaeia archaeon]